MFSMLGTRPCGYWPKIRLPHPQQHPVRNSLYKEWKFVLYVLSLTKTCPLALPPCFSQKVLKPLLGRLTTLHHHFVGLALHLTLQAQLAPGPFEVLLLHHWPLLLLHLTRLEGGEQRGKCNPRQLPFRSMTAILTSY